MLFEPNHAIFNQTDLQVETALILPDDNNKVKITVSQVSSTVIEGQVEESSIAKAMLDEIVSLQLEDLLIAAIVQYLTDGILPEEPKLAKQFVLERHRYTLIDNGLYFIDPDPPNRLRLAVPQSCKQKLLEESHAGSFGGRFAVRGLYRLLSHHFCRSCLTCASYRGTRRKVKAPTPYPCQWSRVGVDILEMPLTTSGNKMLFLSINLQSGLKPIPLLIRQQKQLCNYWLTTSCVAMEFLWNCYLIEGRIYCLD